PPPFPPVPPCPPCGTVGKSGSKPPPSPLPPPDPPPPPLPPQFIETSYDVSKVVQVQLVSGATCPSHVHTNTDSIENVHCILPKVSSSEKSSPSVLTALISPSYSI